MNSLRVLTTALPSLVLVLVLVVVGLVIYHDLPALLRAIAAAH